jgi:DNA-binding transcriptional MerR regulator
MASRPARHLHSSQQKVVKSAKSVDSGGVPASSLKIGEAARLLGVETYVLRFWETQFPELRPYHTATKHRLYRAQDMEMLRLIKHLLYEEGFTIEGARKRIKELAHTQGHANAASVANSPTRGARQPVAVGTTEVIQAPKARQALIDIRRDLESIYQLLKD